MTKKRRRSGKRFRLLIYERMWKRWALPCILIIPASFVLWWIAPKLSIRGLYRMLAFGPALVSLILLVFTFMAQRLAWVECKPNHLRIQTPIYPLAISYGRIKEVLPRTFAQIHDPSQEKAARREWLSPYWGMTVVVVRLSKYPVSRSWLRLWFSPYLMTPKAPGFVFPVKDWMALSRQIDDFRSAWEQRRTEKRQEKLADRAW